ncbi:MAG: 50S ribosomal protein L22 [Pseudomonadota bacterium]
MYKAQARFVRISSTKVRRLIHAVEGKGVEDMLNSLKFMPQKGAAILSKVIKSAVANANEGHGVDVDSLVIRNICVDQGVSLKRTRPRAQGRAYRILKRTSHVTVILDEQ